ncbi:ferric reductase-like transmembrane domain-containing protein [Bacillus aquiflavi]|uniref:Ferric reductase-like transmembrane domain-containing protein n=1 Tax=Bacillus aquiflavi TaxID=2672567 RepID=A0A6B3VUF1_9BACI|nr:ferric reductase-like transmembrane domain-containing protein [Bacillus aquiflavi]MBA4537363.1 ferric reductase-like transmembrane domain-containing protein [Bacillus aquiflavi]NEY81619.1 iron reductase [Bacillus aquiflavi]UAC49187.1 ferric reductase-like transmembrane domain-containing protein [Bacillus aquiflavi]
MTEIVELLSVWNLIRLSGFLAFFYLTMSIFFGMLSSFSWLKRKKGLFHHFHLLNGWIGFLAIIFHIVILLYDQYIQYSLSELFIPFTATHKPISSGLGTISFFLFLFILLAADFWMKSMNRTVWKALHLLVYPAWLLMFIHGILIGTDSAQTWAVVLYGSSFVVIVLLFGLKLLEISTLQKHPQMRKRLSNK